MSIIIKYKCPICKKKFDKSAMVIVESNGEIVKACCQPCNTKERAGNK